MAQQLLSVEQVKEALGIETFRNLSKEKIMEFVSLIPNMDKDVAMSIINQFPAYAEMAGGMIVKLDEMCDTAMVKAGESQKESISAYKMILADLGELLKKDDMRFCLFWLAFIIAPHITKDSSEYNNNDYPKPPFFVNWLLYKTLVFLLLHNAHTSKFSKSIPF